jgi:hypothetical protein
LRLDRQSGERVRSETELEIPANSRSRSQGYDLSRFGESIGILWASGGHAHEKEGVAPPFLLASISEFYLSRGNGRAGSEVIGCTSLDAQIV